jgi:hypothetical protein
VRDHGHGGAADVAGSNAQDVSHLSSRAGAALRDHYRLDDAVPLIALRLGGAPRRGAFELTSAGVAGIRDGL